MCGAIHPTIDGVVCQMSGEHAQHAARVGKPWEAKWEKWENISFIAQPITLHTESPTRRKKVITTISTASVVALRDRVEGELKKQFVSAPEEDASRLGEQLARVASCMADGEWRTLFEIAGAVGAPEASVSARLRDMRKPEFGAKTVERMRLDGGLHRYRVVD